jgi:hypothetical protein
MSLTPGSGPEGIAPLQTGRWAYCWHCGGRLAFEALYCPHCGVAPPDSGRADASRSPKSFGVAVALCGVFGTMGVHHFYLGNWLHGLFDLGLFVASVALWITAVTTEEPTLLLLAIGCFLVDIVHTFFIFYRLITGQQHDSSGRLVRFPGQFD